MSIAKNVKPMPEPLKTLLLQGIKIAGTLQFPEAIGFVEEQLTLPQVRQAEGFLNWLVENSLTIGHGTIDLRFHEFTKKLKPVSREEARDWAIANRT